MATRMSPLLLVVIVDRADRDLGLRRRSPRSWRPRSRPRGTARPPPRGCGGPVRPVLCAQSAHARDICHEIRIDSILELVQFFRKSQEGRENNAMSIASILGEHARTAQRRRHGAGAVWRKSGPRAGSQRADLVRPCRSGAAAALRGSQRRQGQRQGIRGHRRGPRHRRAVAARRLGRDGDRFDRRAARRREGPVRAAAGGQAALRRPLPGSEDGRLDRGRRQALRHHRKVRLQHDRLQQRQGRPGRHAVDGRR